MILIRREQMEVFEQVALKRFEDEMVDHSKEYASKICKVLGDAQVREVVRQAMRRADAHGFTYRGPIRLYIEITYLCGSHFDTDPQCAALGKILNGPEDQMERAEQMHRGVNRYLRRVSGKDNVYVRRALEDLSVFARMPVEISADDVPGYLLQEMHRIFPRRANFIGEEGLTELIREGRAEARKFDLEPGHPEVLMFAFGHGCTDDPLYPWISRTLRDARIVSPSARAERLERKAVTWLDHVLAGETAGERAHD
jgi:diadenosine tetraphosphatase ApaH/serine/threonine PP2A family protein phosphatase